MNASYFDSMYSMRRPVLPKEVIVFVDELSVVDDPQQPSFESVNVLARFHHIVGADEIEHIVGVVDSTICPIGVFNFKRYSQSGLLISEQPIWYAFTFLVFAAWRFRDDVKIEGLPHLFCVKISLLAGCLPLNVQLEITRDLDERKCIRSAVSARLG
ncbi:MAG: hypothetical protein INR71_06930 [Terriglobus roseus]|nr:hypothetical protein [Terriglobus roseus]